VLIVEDDDAVREVLAEQLEDIGFATLVAFNGNETLALLDSGESVEVMISDFLMPGMNGIETIMQARERQPQLLCFLLTGGIGERGACAGQSAFQLIHKPVVGPTLAARIEAGLAMRRAVQR